MEHASRFYKQNLNFPAWHIEPRKKWTKFADDIVKSSWTLFLRVIFDININGSANIFAPARG